MGSSTPRRIGAYLLADESGFLPSQSGTRQIKRPWVTAVDHLVNRYLSEWGADVHSIYVRGSVARDLAMPGVSDIDSFAVLVPESAEPDRGRLAGWSAEVDREVRQSFPFVAGVEVDLVPVGAVLDRRNFYAFVMKTAAVCLHGESLASRLRPFRLSEVDFQTRYFREHLEVFITEFPEEPVAERPAFVAWIAKRFLRLGMELVMEREKRYSPDLYLCYESFAKHYPQHAKSMYRALELAVHPVADEGAEQFLHGFGSWLALEADRRLAASVQGCDHWTINS